MSRTIGAPLQQSDLREGDILLSRGEGPLSDHIIEMAGGSYSHSAVYIGEGEIVEATLPRTRRITLHASQDHPRRYTDVYRHRDITNQAPAIAEKALSFICRDYSLADLLYVYVRLIRRSARGAEVTALEKMVDQFLAREEAGELVTCTELVSRAFCAAGLHISVPSGLLGTGGVSEALRFMWKEGHRLIFRGASRFDGLGKNSHRDDDAMATIGRADLDLAHAKFREPRIGAMYGMYGSKFGSSNLSGGESGPPTPASLEARLRRLRMQPQLHALVPDAARGGRGGAVSAGATTRIAGAPIQGAIGDPPRSAATRLTGSLPAHEYGYHLVTPHGLEKSPSIRFVGHLELDRCHP